MNPSNLLQTQPEIGNDYYNAASAVSLNAHHQVKKSSLFTIDLVAEPVPNAAQTLEEQHFEELESQQLYLDCLPQFWHKEVHLFAMQLEEYSNEAHLSAVMVAFQYSEKMHATDKFTPDFEGKDDDSFPLLPNPTKTPIISKDFLRALPHCSIIHWAFQMDKNPKLCFCPCSKHSSPWRENNKIFIHEDHECKMGLMTTQDLLKHLKNEGDCTHTAVYIYL
jgi:hypothetical protein